MGTKQTIKEAVLQQYILKYEPVREGVNSRVVHIFGLFPNTKIHSTMSFITKPL